MGNDYFSNYQDYLLFPSIAFPCWHFLLIKLTWFKCVSSQINFFCILFAHIFHSFGQKSEVFHFFPILDAQW